MEKNQRKPQNLFFKLRTKSSILRVISVFFLLSIISFLLSFNREFNQIFFNQFNSFKHFLNKKAMFCYFNAILLFVAKDSGLLASSVEKPKAAGRPGQNFAENSQLLQTKNITAEENSKIYPTKKITVKQNQQVLVIKSIVVEAKEVEKMKPALMEGDDSSKEEEEDEEAVREMEELAIEELNKKCEEFIYRIKQEIKMEALRGVVA